MTLVIYLVHLCLKFFPYKMRMRIPTLSLTPIIVRSKIATACSKKTNGGTWCLTQNNAPLTLAEQPPPPSTLTTHTSVPTQLMPISQAQGDLPQRLRKLIMYLLTGSSHILSRVRMVKRVTRLKRDLGKDP